MAAGFGYTAGPPGSSGGLTRPNSQPAPTQPGFGTQSQQRPLTQPPASGFGQAGGLGALQQFNQQGSFGGFTPQFGGFGQNPQMQQYRQQLDAWRSQRPDMQPGMDRDAFRQQMDAYRDMRPDRPNMQQPGMPQYQQNASLLGAYNQALQGAGQPGVLDNPATLTPQQIQSMQGVLGAFAGAGAQPQVGMAAPQAQIGMAAPEQVAKPPMAPRPPLQAAMPQAPNTQQIAQEDPRMQAMRNMQRTRPGFAG